MTSTGVNKAAQTQPERPRFQPGKAMLVAGLKQRFNGPDIKNISGLWQRFSLFLGRVPDQVGQIAYGLCANLKSFPFGFDYTAGVEVSKAESLPPDFHVTNIPVMRYAIFTHHEAVAKLSTTIDAIFHQWLPNSEQSLLQVAPDVPYLIERYDERFNPQTASGDVELWIPIKG